MKSIKGVTLNVANKVYIKEGGYELNEDLKIDAVKIFDAALEKVNFGDSVKAAKLINDWVNIIYKIILTIPYEEIKIFTYFFLIIIQFVI